MKLNWGTGIVIAFIAFASFIGYMVVQFFQGPVNMVSKNYYQEEAAYLENKAKTSNLSKLDKLPELRIDTEQKAVVFELPVTAKVKEGIIKFYRPSDQDMDFQSSLQPNANGQQLFPVNEIASGRWVVKVEWKDEQYPYYFEQSIVIP
ncbi:FixH family protein [Algivirga pacifica]|uniref:FixH family protein n=1 Tax=Algivirga pacifica TaxID=1162670 RepID=A0ABP9D522_9BACT